MILLLALLACSTDPCARYADLSFAHGRCIAQRAPEAPDLASARCTEAGGAEEDCRILWVQTHLDRGIDELIAACTTEECRFIALDFRPSPLAEQIRRCEALPTLAESCVNHAFVRFIGGRPDAETVRREAAGLGRWAGMASQEAGNARRCGFDIDCGAYGDVGAACSAPPPGSPPCNVYRPDFPRGLRP